MSKVAVLGPIATRVAIVQQCLRCRGAEAGDCRGFGPGCLGLHAVPGCLPRSDEDLKVRLHVPDPSPA